MGASISEICSRFGMQALHTNKMYIFIGSGPLHNFTIGNNTVNTTDDLNSDFCFLSPYQASSLLRPHHKLLPPSFSCVSLVAQLV